MPKKELELNTPEHDQYIEKLKVKKQRLESEYFKVSKELMKEIYRYDNLIMKKCK